jgi:large subunit ribosomal protein L6
MSRLTKKPLALGTATVSVDGGVLTVKGPKATLTKRVHPLVSINVEGQGVVISPKDSSRLAKALSGTFASHVKNMFEGTEKSYEKKLVLEGVGYRMEIKGKDVVLTVGFSHTVSLPVPDGITATAEKNVLKLESADKEILGQFAADVRAVKPPEPYLGKGIRYDDEVILRKQGKKAV